MGRRFRRPTLDQPAGKRRGFEWRLIAAFLVAVLAPPVVPAAVLLAQQKQQQASEGEEEPVDDDSDHDWMAMDLLQVPDGFDLLTLVDGTVYEIDLVEPRPLPKMAASDELVVQLRNFVPTHNKVQWSNVESVKYFEELLLEKGDLLREQKRFNEAYEHYAAVERKSPHWEGLAERKQQLLAENADWEIGRGQPVRALALAEELNQLNPQHPSLTSLVDRVVPMLVEGPLESGTYREGRWWLDRLGQSFSTHPTVVQWRERYQQRARDLLAQAQNQNQEQAGQLAEATRLARQAAVAWPQTPGVSSYLARLGERYPRLVVAVADLPRQFGVWPESSADRRAASLIHLPMVELTSLDEGGQYESRLFASIDTRDLGRGLTLRLRPELVTGDLQSSITANDVAATLIARAEPTNRHSDPRWREMLQSVGPQGLFEVRIDFARPPVNPEAWLAEYVQPSGAGQAAGSERSEPSSAASSGVAAGLGPFQVASLDKQTARYTARHPDAPAGRGLREIVECKMEEIAALDALVHGEIDLISRISLPAAQKLRQERSVKVRRLVAPEMHVIAFNFNRRELRSHTLRRALMYGIERQRLLEETVLHGPADVNNSLVEGPFPKESYATIPDLDPVPYSPLLARGLVEATRKEFDGHLPSLTLGYSPGMGHREVCEALQRNWQEIGLNIEIVERNGDGDDGPPPDLNYRTYQVFDPVRQTPEIVMGFRGASVADFPASVSPWLSSLLVELERAEHWLSAREILRSVHRAIREQAVLIPLWQVEVLFAQRAELSGLADAPLSLYQDVENWKLEPVVPD